jgi:hypothetical protein
MTTIAGHDKPLLELQELYQQGDYPGCIKECERILSEHAGMPPYWRVQICCLLVGSHEDWHEAEVKQDQLQDRKRK